MRLILFFDLPMVTKEEVRVYTRFRKYLIEEGYIMIQFSVYCKLFANRDAATLHIASLKNNVPTDGHVRVMMVTEKQYAKILLLVGNKTQQEEVVSGDPFVRL